MKNPDFMSGSNHGIAHREEANSIMNNEASPPLVPPVEGIGETLPAKIHELLEEAIIRGTLAPSSRLNADDIAARYGISRIPVREALRSLHEAGWVDIRPRIGTYVRDRSMTELRELFEARSGIEAHIAELAADRRTEEDLRRFDAIVSRGRASVNSGDLEGMSQASVDFYNTIRNCCGNSLLASLAASLEKRARFYFSMVEGNLGSDWIDTEEQLVESIRQQNISKAGEITRQHILNTGLAVAKLLEKSNETVSG